jgi:hypothetical protein
MAKKNIYKIDNIKTRLLQYAENKGYAKIDFYNKIDVAPSLFSNSQLQSAISSNKIVEILTIFPDLSAEWLFRGQGQMIIAPPPPTEDTDYLQSRIQQLENNIKSLEYIVHTQEKLINLYENRIKGGY